MAFATINYYSHSLEQGVVLQRRLPRRARRPRALVGLLPAPRPVRRPHDLDAPVVHRALRARLSADGRHARRRPGLVHQRRRRLRLRGRPDQGSHRPDRADLPGQGRALRPGDRRALDGRLRRGQARAEAPRALRQRQLALGRARVPPRPRPSPGRSAPSSRGSSARSPPTAPKTRFAWPTRPTGRNSRRSGSTAATKTRSSSRTAASTSTWRLWTSPTNTRNIPATHNWSYWDLHVREALDFHATQPGYPRRPRACDS